jgi:hypothetical protein
MNIQLSPTLSWNAIAGAVSYHLQLSTASVFITCIVNDSTLTTPSRATGPLSLATTYYWRVRAKNDGGYGSFSATRQFRTIRTTSVEQSSDEIPKEYAVSQNYPNPFNPSTIIRFSLPNTAHVSLRIFNTLGQEVALLLNERRLPGYYQVQWNATVPSGIYFYRLQAGEFVETKKMILLR